MSKRFLTILFCLVLIPLIPRIPIWQASAQSANKVALGVWNPDAASPFRVPEKFQDLLRNYRRNWTRLTNLEFSGLHWKQGIVVYINKNYKTFLRNYIGFLKIQEDLLEDEEDEEDLFSVYPVGTIVLKENYLLEKGIPTRVSTVTVMIKKRKGYNPELGDWEFLQYEKDGKILLAGSSKNPVVQATCAFCHKNMESRDYIFSTFYRPKPGDKFSKQR